MDYLIWLIPLLCAAVICAFFGIQYAVKNKKITTARLVRAAMAAAVYVVLCLALQPLSYGPVQVRVAEALTLLPVFGAEYIVGVTLGCLIANLLGSGIIDAVFGTAATLIAALLSYRLRYARIKGLAIPAAIAPVVVNAVVVGAELSLFFSGSDVTAPVVLLNMLTVGLGEVVSCLLLGVALIRLIEKSPGLSRLFSAKTEGR